MSNDQPIVNLFNKVRSHGRTAYSTIGYLTEIKDKMNALEFDCENKFNMHRRLNEASLELIFEMLDTQKFRKYLAAHQELSTYYSRQKTRFTQLKAISYE